MHVQRPRGANWQQRERQRRIVFALVPLNSQGNRTSTLPPGGHTGSLDHFQVGLSSVFIFGVRARGRDENPRGIPSENPFFKIILDGRVAPRSTHAQSPALAKTTQNLISDSLPLCSSFVEK